MYNKNVILKEVFKLIRYSSMMHTSTACLWCTHLHHVYDVHVYSTSTMYMPTARLWCNVYSTSDVTSMMYTSTARLRCTRLQHVWCIRLQHVYDVHVYDVHVYSTSWCTDHVVHNGYTIMYIYQSTQLPYKFHLRRTSKRTAGCSITF